MPIATTKPHPHLPIPLGQLSVWQQSTRDHPLLNAGKDEEIPEEADVVVVGSGMCGAVIANTLLESQDRPNKIVVLEAREICAGASGRNAGHCRPDAARGFTAFSGLHGAEEAKHILSSETDVLKRVDAFINKHNIQCEWTPRPTYDVCLSDEFKTYEEEALAGLRAAGGEPEGFSELDAEEAKDDTRKATPIIQLIQQASRIAQSVGAFKWSAATLNPAQLTLGIHQLNVDKGGYSLYAWAPVHRVDPIDPIDNSSSNNKWAVVTNRGIVRTPKVVFATNAYSQAVVPELEGLIVPWRAQAVKLPPAPDAEAFPRLEPSFSLRKAVHDFYSVAPRPDGSIILGTSRQFSGMPPSLRHSLINTVDDSGPFDAITSNALAAWGDLFPSGKWDTRIEANGQPGGHEYSWTGIIGMTPDAVPFIGEVPGKDGQFVAAGYNGHGMARIFLCAPSLAKYIQTGEWDPAMPASFRVTSERLDRLREKVGLAKAAGKEDDSTAEGLAKMIG